MCCFIPLPLCEEEIAADEADVNLALPYCEALQLFGSSDDVGDFAALIMNERNIPADRKTSQKRRKNGSRDDILLRRCHDVFQETSSKHLLGDVLNTSSRKCLQDLLKTSYNFYKTFSGKRKDHLETIY